MSFGTRIMGVRDGQGKLPHALDIDAGLSYQRAACANFGEPRRSSKSGVGRVLKYLTGASSKFKVKK
jgi:hypothetical protein